MEAKDRLLELYRLAVANGVVKNRKQFATLIHTAEGTLSNSINGAPKYAGTAETLVKRAESELKIKGVSVDGSTVNGSSIVSGDNNTIGVPPKNFYHEEEWFALVAEKDRQINRLLSIIEKMQKG